MKKIPIFLLLLAPYAILFIYYIASIDITMGIYLYVFLIIFNVIYAFLLPKLGFSSKQILSWNLALKFSNLPIILLILLFALVMVLVGGKNLADESFAIFLIALGICYILQLSSSMFGISGYLSYYKEKIISEKEMILRSILQFIPIVDIASSCISNIALKRNKAKVFKDDDDE